MEAIVDDTRLQKQLIELRILLQKVCDGFDADGASKHSILTMRHKVLFLLDEMGALSPAYMIENLGIAKSNLALLCKGLIEERLIVSKKCIDDKRSITYEITEKGQNELNAFLYTMKQDNINLFRNEKERKTIERKLTDVIEYIKLKSKD